MKSILISALTICGAFAALAAQYSKLGIITAAKSIGKWPALKAWIAQAGYEDEWQAASFFSDSYPQFAAITNSVCATGMATPEEVAAILSAAEDKAPDALLPVFYTREMQSDSGRVKWHGSQVGKYEIELPDGTFRLVQLYADGFAWTNAAKIIHRDDPEAEAKRRAEAEKRQQEYERAHFPADVAALLAARRAAAVTTNEVDVIVRP